MTFDQQLLVTFECTSSIGTSLDLHPMLKSFLKTFSRKTGAIVGGYWQSKDGSHVLEVFHGKKSLLELLYPINTDEKITITYNEEQNKQIVQISTANGWLLFIFQIHKDELQNIISILLSLDEKLSNAIQACISHALLKSLNEELMQKVEIEVAKNREKDKHILQQSRQAQMGEMISMIAHQWRQPLSSISTVVASIKLKQSLGKYDLSQEDHRVQYTDFIATSLDKIEKYVKFLTTTIDDFRNFFKPNKEKDKISSSLMLEKTLNIISKALEINNITLSLQEKDESSYETYSNEVMQVILNIIKNAEDIFKEKDQEEKQIRISTFQTKTHHIIQIDDNAGGIPEEIIDKIFEPYFSTKNVKNGTGLGLYMSKTIIEDHCEGYITASNIEGGARFTIGLPS